MLKAVTGELSEFGIEKIKVFKQSFKKKSDKELAAAYFRQMKVGITGVSMQLYYIIALREVLLERFGDSPIYYDGRVLEL
ncbi:hypothetical protein [Eudoraea chungangensis]|uniref:hypothetical protein n=1 Tax=Eudoraea chungangensis TaxID=1481905 RepID=UPI0023ED5DD6|nr:hypothetical protein [Eudoraea chungangensis]